MEKTFVESPLVLWTLGLLDPGSMGLLSASNTAQPLQQKAPCRSICRVSRTIPTALPTPRCTKPFYSLLHPAISGAPPDKLQLAGAVTFLFRPLRLQPLSLFSLHCSGETQQGWRGALWGAESGVELPSAKSWPLDRRHHSSSSQPAIPQR